MKYLLILSLVAVTACAPANPDAPDALEQNIQRDLNILGFGEVYVTELTTKQQNQIYLRLNDRDGTLRTQAFVKQQIKMILERAGVR